MINNWYLTPSQPWWLYHEWTQDCVHSNLPSQPWWLYHEWTQDCVNSNLPSQPWWLYHEWTQDCVHSNLPSQPWWLWMNTGLCPQQFAQSTVVVISWMNTGLCPQQFALGNSTSIPGQQQCCHDIVSNNSWWILYFLFICILSLEYNSLGSNCIPGAVLQCVLFCCVMHKSYHVNWEIKMV